MSILFVGDTHGSFAQVAYALLTAHSVGVDTVIQVGDFGYFEHLDDGILFLDQIEQLPADLGSQMTLFFIDGNHECHPRLAQYPLDRDGLRPVRPNLFHIPRGDGMISSWFTANSGHRSAASCRSSPLPDSAQQGSALLPEELPEARPGGCRRTTTAGRRPAVAGVFDGGGGRI